MNVTFDPEMVGPDYPHVIQTMDSADPLPIPTWNSLRMAAMQNVDEVCGFISSRYDLHFVTNAHHEPGRHFLMDKDDYKRAIERIYVSEEKIIGVFHTHPSGDPRPSAGDIAGWPNPQLGWRYFVATTSEVYEYSYENQPQMRGHWSGLQLRA